MIPVARSAKPAILHRKANVWLSELKQLMRNPAIPKAQLTNAQNKYRHDQIKDALEKMFHGKCAYCESKITVVTYGAIDHFFPKSKYIDLTFEWNNLLLACDRCNGVAHKGAKFPLDSTGNPLLIDPSDGITAPSTHLEFSWDAIAGLASVYGRDERGKTVETIFDLNGVYGRKELITHRSNYVKKLLALLRLAQTGDSEALALLQEACAPKAEYSAFALIHIYPQLLKSIEQRLDKT